MTTKTKKIASNPVKVDVKCEDVILSDSQLYVIESVIDDAFKLESIESEFFMAGRKDLSDKIRILLESVDGLKDSFYSQLYPGTVNKYK